MVNLKDLTTTKKEPTYRKVTARVDEEHVNLVQSMNIDEEVLIRAAYAEVADQIERQNKINGLLPKQPIREVMPKVVRGEYGESKTAAEKIREVLTQRGPMSIEELQDETKISYSTIYHALQTMSDELAKSATRPIVYRLHSQPDPALVEALAGASVSVMR